MKKIIIAITIILPVLGYGQGITITKNDMPIVGDTIRISMTSSLQGVNPQLTGSNYTWDYNNLIPDSQRIKSFLNVNAAPYEYQLFFNNSYLFPEHKADISLPVPSNSIFTGGQVQIEDLYYFFKINNNEYTQVGFGAKINTIPSSVKFDSLDIEYRFPLNYLNEDSCVSKFALDIPNLGYYGSRRKRLNTVDGYGTLITPYGTFQTIRVKSINYIQDTIFNSVMGFGIKLPLKTEIEYKWLATNQDIPLLKIISTNGLVTKVEYKDIPRYLLGVKDNLNQGGVDLIQNPIRDLLKLKVRDKVISKLKISIYDYQGNLIQDLFYNNILIQNEIIEIPMNYETGLYFIRLISNKEEITKKIFINKD